MTKAKWGAVLGPVQGQYQSHKIEVHGLNCLKSEYLISVDGQDFFEMEYYSPIRDNCASDELEMTGCFELNSVDLLEKKKELN